MKKIYPLTKMSIIICIALILSLLLNFVLADEYFQMKRELKMIKPKSTRVQNVPDKGSTLGPIKKDYPV